MFDFIDAYHPTDLIAREPEEMLRTSTRTLSFPDGETRHIEAYRLAWTWFDRLIAFEFGPDEAQILKTALACQAEEKLPIGLAFTRVVEFFVTRTEAEVGDLTDDNLALLVSKRRMQAWRDRRRGGEADKEENRDDG